MRKLLSLLYFLPLFCLGQIVELKEQLNNTARSEPDRASIYLELSKAYWREHLDSAAAYTYKAHNLAVKTTDMAALARSFIQLSMLSNYQNDERSALQQLDSARKIIENQGLRSIEPDLYHRMGQAYRKKPDSALICYNRSIEIAKALGMRDLVLKNKIRISLILMHQKNHSELARLYDILIPELKAGDDYEGLMETYTYMALNFRDLYEKEKSLLYTDRALSISDKVSDKKLKAFVYGALGSGVKAYFQTFEDAVPLVEESSRYAREINDRQLLTNNSKRMAILHYNNENYVAASTIIDSLLTDTIDPDVFKTKGMILYEQGQFDLANHFYDKAYLLYEKDKAYIQQKVVLQLKLDSKLALLGDQELTRDFLTLDSLIAAIHNSESKNKFFDLETKYLTAEKEAEIQRKELALAKARNHTLSLSGVAVFLLGAGVFGMRFMRINQKKKELEYNNQLFELKNSLNTIELANLNSQLNPHEIKNLITSIAPDLIAQAPDAYKKMIRLFNVTRASLSNDLTENLSEQLQQLEDFLLLQQTISPKPWVFQIDDQTDGLSIALPRLLLKNAAENAIKHGVSRVDTGGEILVTLVKKEEYLVVVIKDNGPGVHAMGESSGSGIGFSTYQKLFTFINTKNRQKASMSLIREGQWTKMEVLLPLDYQYHV